MQNEYKVSVVIPTYGRPKTLVRAVNSVLNDGFDDFEVIIVDDNNPDTPARAETEEIMRGYAQNNRVKYIKHEKNKNGAAARNTGIFAATGKYIAFLDDDDRFLPGHLSKLYSFLESHSEFTGAYTLGILNGVPTKSDKQGDLTENLLLGNYCAPTSTLMLSRSALCSINGFDESYRRHQDVEIMIRYFEAGYTLGVVKEILTVMDNTDDLNRPHGEALEQLKANFLNKFSGVIDRLEQKKPGSRRRIICENQARVWADYLHRGPFKRMLAVYKKYSRQYPFYFTFVCLKFTVKVAYIKISKKLFKAKRMRKTDDI